jgi:hypothetical protein
MCVLADREPDVSYSIRLNIIRNSDFEPPGMWWSY